MDQLRSTVLLPFQGLEQVRTQQAERLQAGLRNSPALLLPLANRRRLDIEKASNCCRSTQCGDELLAVHDASIGSPMAVSIGSPIFLFSRLA